MSFEAFKERVLQLAETGAKWWIPKVAAWLDYFYPETVTPDGYSVLRNNLGIRDFNAP